MKKIQDMNPIELNDYMHSLTKKQAISTILYCSTPLIDLYTEPNIFTPAMIAYWTYYMSLIIRKRQAKIASMHMCVCNEEIHLLKIYKDILLQIKKLSGELEENTLLDRYLLLEYLYRHEYLSLMDDEVTLDTDIFNKSLMGDIALNDHGVCRHTSMLVNDYLKQFNYDTSIIVGYNDDRYNTILNNMLRHASLNEEQIEEILFVKQLLGETDAKDTKHKIIEHIIGNHQISQVNDSTNSYYFDLNNGGIYIPTSKRVYTSSFGSELKLRKYIAKYIYLTTNLEQKPSITFDHYMKNKEIHTSKIEDNQDLIEKFYKEITPLLEENERVYQKILKNI